ncbi:MAG: DNA polymerase I [Caldilineaceae bacterium]|nr:DNA polymerase I [Caldilineaceae bacterium]
MPTLLLVDGHSQAYRAFFGVKTPLSTRNGEPTTAVFGFVRKFLSVLREYKPDYAAVAFDTGDTWRHSEFPAYKATRDSMPSEMRTQIERIVEFLEVFGIPVVTYENYEADDIIGTLAHQAAEQDVDVLILTGDRDMFQLINERVRILYTKGGPTPETVIYGLPELRERYSLAPDQFVDLKALIGDNSDNIPGVTGVGEKTAIKYLTDFGTVANLYENLDKISGPKTRQNLEQAREDVARNQRLMKIDTDLELTFDPTNCRVGEYDQQAVLRFFNTMEFRSLARELPQQAVESELSPTGGDGQMALFAGEEAAQGATASLAALTVTTPAGIAYKTVQSAADLEALVGALRGAQLISFDVESTSTDAMQAVLVGLGIAWAEGEAAYIPVAHSEGEQLPWETVREAIQPFFANADVPKVAHNAKYDVTVCLRHGLTIDGPIHDTMVMAWVLDPGSHSLGLKAQAATLLDWHMTEITELIGSGRKQITMEAVPIAPAAAYCGADVDATIRIYEILSEKLHSTGMWDLYTQIELPLLPVLIDMEMTGVLLDVKFLNQMSSRLAERLHELEQELFTLVGRPFNLRSTQQLSQVLFDDLGFSTKGMKRTASGHYSTAVGTLEQLAASPDDLTDQQRSVISIIMEQRQLEKLRSTYVDALPTLVNPTTGRVHTSFNQAGAVTGRMSSSNPNLQNIPIRTELGREIRRAFIAPPGWKLLSADYSQVELRILAHVTGEPGLVEAFLANQDIHAATAARLFHVSIEQVDRAQRGLAKTINFATIYGVSEFGLSSRTEMSRHEARQFLDQYFVTYPKIRDYIATTIQQANEQGYVETLLGRKRFFPELQNARLPYNQRQAVERAAINAPIQGAAADIMKIAMIHLHDELLKGGYRSRMLLQVHDELVLEVPDEESAAMIDLTCHVMESAYTLNVPLKVDVEIGPDWYNQEPAQTNNR